MKPCREWQRACNSQGYGVVRLGAGQGRLYYVHRYVWSTIHGQIPPGMKVCHTCDNRRCFEPSHLWLGTQGDNIRDARDKGRLAPTPWLLKRRANVA